MLSRTPASIMIALSIGLLALLSWNALQAPTSQQPTLDQAAERVAQAGLSGRPMSETRAAALQIESAKLATELAARNTSLAALIVSGVGILLVLVGIASAFRIDSSIQDVKETSRQVNEAREKMNEIQAEARRQVDDAREHMGTVRDSIRQEQAKSTDQLQSLAAQAAELETEFGRKIETLEAQAESEIGQLRQVARDSGARLEAQVVGIAEFFRELAYLEMQEGQRAGISSQRSALLRSTVYACTEIMLRYGDDVEEQGKIIRALSRVIHERTVEFLARILPTFDDSLNGQDSYRIALKTRDMVRESLDSQARA